MIGQDYEKAIVALISWKMMRSELYRGQISVCQMLNNRAADGWFEGSIYNNAVAFAQEQKMTWDDCPDAREPQFQQLLQAIDGVFAGTLPDKTGGAMYCAHVSCSDSIAGEITTQIGQYIFFRERI